MLLKTFVFALVPSSTRLKFVSGEGPVIGNPVRSGEDVDALSISNTDDLGYVGDAIRQVVAALEDDRFAVLDARTPGRFRGEEPEYEQWAACSSLIGNTDVAGAVVFLLMTAFGSVNGQGLFCAASEGPSSSGSTL